MLKQSVFLYRTDVSLCLDTAVTIAWGKNLYLSKVSLAWECLSLMPGAWAYPALLPAPAFSLGSHREPFCGCAAPGHTSWDQQHRTGAHGQPLCAVQNSTWVQTQSCACALWHSRAFFRSSWVLSCLSFSGKQFLFLRWPGLPWGKAGAECPVPAGPSPLSRLCLLCLPPRQPKLLSCSHPSTQLWHKWPKSWNRNPGKDRIHHSTGIFHAVLLGEMFLPCSPGLPSVGEWFGTKNCFFTTSTPYPKKGAISTSECIYNPSSVLPCHGS